MLQMGLKPAIGLRILAPFTGWLAIAIIWHAVHEVDGVAHGIIADTAVLFAALETRYVDFVLIFAT